METIGKYEVRGKLGEGGFGVVWEGWDPHLKRRVAIKTCTAEDPDLRKRFAREAEAAGALDHPNVVRIHEFGYHGETPYLVQEFLGGEDLSKLLELQRTELSLYKKLDILAQVARGLEHAHRHGIVHRDVKPGNIRVLPDGRVKLMDFGIARLESSATRLTRTGTAIGTVAYMAPEQVEGDAVTAQADLFSLGVVAYELLSGVRPFDAESMSRVFYRILNEHPRPLSDLDPALPPLVASLVARCLAKRPEDRPPGAGDVALLLEAALRERSDPAFAQSTLVAAARLGELSGAALDARQSQSAPQPPVSKGRNRQLLFAGVAGAVLVGITVLFLGLRNREAAQGEAETPVDLAPAHAIEEARRLFEAERPLEALRLAYGVRRRSEVSQEAQELASQVLEHLARSVREARQAAEAVGASELATELFAKGDALEDLALERLTVGYWVGSGEAYENAALAFYEAARAAELKRRPLVDPAGGGADSAPTP